MHSARHETYVKKGAFRRYCERLFDEYGWSRFVLGEEAPKRRRGLRERVRGALAS